MKYLMILFAVLVFNIAPAAQFDGVNHDYFDLGGKCAAVDEIGQREWNGLKLVVSNGEFRINNSYWTHGGLTEVGPGASLTICKKLTTGQGDAGIRVFKLGDKSRLSFEDVEWHMDHTRVELPAGSEWVAGFPIFTLDGGMKDNLWDLAGRAILYRGIKVAKGGWGCQLKVVLHEGGELGLGGPVGLFGAEKCGLEVVLEGGTVTLFWDAKIEPGIVKLAPGAKVTVNVAKGVDFDEKSIEVPADAELKVKRNVKVPFSLPARYTFEVKYDRTGRSYWISADKFKDAVKKLAIKYPNPDPTSPNKFEIAKPEDTLFRHRFPEGKGPWTVSVALKDIHDETYRTNIVVRRPENPLKPPAPNDLVFVGQCGYDEAFDLTKDVMENDMCNLYVGWHTAAKMHPDAWTNETAETKAKWTKAIKDRKLWTMSIYAGDGRELQDKLNELYEGRYLGNNIGEYASFMYQGRENCGIPMNVDLQKAKDAFVNRYCGRIPFGWESNFPWTFSTCGAALSCYELQGGIDFICNEQWAIGAQNVAHTSAEARGAARKWGPEYWCAWNAHEWQTCGVPYRTAQKYDSCLVGFLQEYIAGTSMIVLESGAQGKQAWPYTADFKDQPKEERAKEGYDGYVAQHYRDITTKFWKWVEANPRDKGTPETKIAMALGNLDAYLGQDGRFTVWSQHDNAEKDHQRWKYGPPERTQAMVEDVFFPRLKAFMEPYGNGWLAGTPYGQVDVMQIDDESTLGDLKRYELLVFGGWNTMTPHVKDVLERYIKAGGTVVMSRPEFTKRIDRDFIGYTDADLDPLFGELPPEGADGEFIEKGYGKGRLFLFTSRNFPAQSEVSKKAYSDLVKRLASEVKQTVRITAEDYESVQAIYYAVYGKKMYFLNVDTVHERTFTYTYKGKAKKLTLKPCEILVVNR